MNVKLRKLRCGTNGAADARSGFSAFCLRPSALRRCAGLSLIEIMVAVSLLVVIMLGLFAVFNATQRAFRLSTSQTDVLEQGRGTMTLLTRELQELTPSGQEGVINIMASTPSGLGGIDMPRPGGGSQQNVLQDFYFLTRQNDIWTGVGYFVNVRTEGVGTLHRFTSQTTNGPTLDLWRPYQNFLSATVPQSGRVAEGIVHLKLRAFDKDGIEFVPADSTTNRFIWNSGFAFTNDLVPAYIDLELGVLDPRVYRQFKSMSPAAGANFLRNQVGQVYLFRQRIPIRNHEP